MDTKSDSQHVETMQPAVAKRRCTWQVILFSMLANIGPLMFGYNLVIIGAVTALPTFQHDYGQPNAAGKYTLPALWVGLWAGLVQLGVSGGSVIAGWFQDRFGRRPSFLLGGLLGAAGTAISYSSAFPSDTDHRRIMFLLAKIIIGIACGILLSTCQTYISEIAPIGVRAIVLGFYAFNISVGHLFATVAVFTQTQNQTSSAYQVPFATQWAFAAFAVILVFILPESPVWLLLQERYDEAHQVIKRLGEKNSEQVLQGMQATLINERATEAHGSENPTYKECFQGTNLRRTRIIIILNLIQQFVGIAIVTNGAYFLTVAGMSSTNALMVNLIGIASSIVANMASWWTVSKFGRRTMTLISIGLDFLAWVSMGIAGCFSSSAAKWYVGVALLLFGFFNSLGVASAIPVISAEISTVRLRSKSQGIGLTAQCIGAWAFNFFAPYLYNSDQANWGGKIGFFFAGLSTIAFAVTWWDVPETLGRSFAQLDELFGENIPARKFKKTQLSVEPSQDTKLGAEMF
ncbi:hypothetical protein PFICI_13446 [Pestalotiopsis fici W106-1]|uniref:Major facilitator superfamily (MFS) profile domain-containing protein n=1 Tax=Pestalotiopsis fici (strain W106-1 / CGMCC3.15140) TaxID=1229662 RepID=W3WP98_PESFW|nr:uncharacterized protein PFICI_13446 [Pestalotiopsis fici W106-1]ETS74962.1 hypothetical protein PFICI_13446 [Pestalotiopsis fici W106-1]